MLWEEGEEHISPKLVSLIKNHFQSGDLSIIRLLIMFSFESSITLWNANLLKIRLLRIERFHSKTCLPDKL